MKKAAIVLIILLYVLCGNAQEFSVIYNTETFDYPSCIFIKNDTIYAEYHKRDQNNSNLSTKQILQLDFAGNIIGELVVDSLKYANPTLGMEHPDDNGYVYFGYSESLGQNNLLITHKNSSFETIQKKIHILPEGEDLYITDCYYKNGYYYIAGSDFADLSTLKLRAHVFKLDQNFEIVQQLTFNQDYYTHAQSFSPFYGDTFVLWVDEERPMHAGIYGYKLSSDLEILSTMEPSFSINDINLRWHVRSRPISNNHILACTSIVIPFSGDVDLIVTNINEDFQLTNTTHVHQDVDSAQQTLERCIDFIDEDYIYTLTTHGYRHTWQQTPAYIHVCRFNSELELVWERYYGDGKYYYTGNEVHATADKGALILGTFYDYNTVPEKDLYILKIDKNGNLVTGVETPAPTAREAIVYPNPGSPELHVRVAVQLGQCHMQLYDMQGRQVLNAEIAPGENTLNTAQLPAGTYIYHIQSGNQTVESGQWTKTR